MQKKPLQKSIVSYSTASWSGSAAPGGRFFEFDIMLLFYSSKSPPNLGVVSSPEILI